MGPDDLLERLRTLPNLVLVAFTTRCALLVRPLANQLPEWRRKAVDDAIDVALAVTQEWRPKSRATARAAATASKAAEAATLATIEAAGATSKFAVAAVEAARAAAKAARATVTAAEAANWAAAEAAAVQVTEEAALEATLATALAGGKDAWDAAEDDIRMLTHLDPPIDLSEAGPLGPLWPNGAPAWYTNPPKLPAETQPTESSNHPDPSPDRLELEAYVGEFADTEEVAGALARLGFALNALHVASGGNGLVVEDWEIRVPADVPVEVEP